MTFRWDEQSEAEVSDGYAVVVTRIGLWTLPVEVLLVPLVNISAIGGETANPSCFADRRKSRSIVHRSCPVTTQFWPDDTRCSFADIVFEKE